MVSQSTNLNAFLCTGDRFIGSQMGCLFSGKAEMVRSFQEGSL